MNRPQKGLAPILILVVIVVVGLALGFFFYKDKIQQFFAKPLTLSLESPQEGSLIVDGNVSVKGETLPGAVVVFYTDEDQNSVEADANGNFQGDISLVYGINTLVVTAFSEDGQEKTVTADVVNDTGNQNI